MTAEKNHQLRGVNLGGWLILERWMTPGLFSGMTARDEFSFMQEPDAAEKIERHRRTFITESDFAWLAKNGVNAVRIPVGYWIFEGDAPFTPCISYLDWAIEMAEKYNLQVLIDFHAAKGSQNGNDHSGRIGVAAWYENSAYRKESIEVLVRLAERYKHAQCVWGIELLNEPKLGVVRYFKLLRFYRQAYAALAAVARPGTRIVFSDGFAPWLFTGALTHKEECPPVMDVHWYQFGRTNLERYFSRLRKRPYQLRCLQKFQPVIVGEWSGMLSHLTLKGLPADEQRRLEKRHIEEQLKAYSTASGWFYWTYKTEGRGIWNFRHQVESGTLLLR